MNKCEGIAMLALNRLYEVVYTNGQGQSQKKSGKLISTNHDGFVVLETDGKNNLIPKERIDSMSQLD